MPRSYVMLFFDWLEKTSELTHEEKGRLIDAIMAYASGQPYELPGNERFLFPVFRAQIDRDAAAYNSISEKRKQAGAKGGKQRQANASICLRDVANTSKSSEEEEKEEEKEKEEYRGYNARGHPPTIDEVRKFMLDASGGWPNVERSADRFWNHHAARGWKLADWQPDALNWIREDMEKDKRAAALNPALNYEQRQNTEWSLIDLEKEYGEGRKNEQ